MADVAQDNSRCLFGSGPAIVIGLPTNFDLCSSIENASEIRLATAFAHWSGWELIENSIRKSGAKSRLLTGLDFCQTGPSVLKAWLELVREGRAAARLYLGDAATFHPKVLLISRGGRRFAIVGSANLSAGGFRNNVECSVFVNDKKLLDELEGWFQSTFTDEEVTRSRTRPDIKEYEPRFKKARKHLASVLKAQRQTQVKIAEQHHSELIRWKEAVSEAKRYFKSAHFRGWYPKEKMAAAKRIKASLGYPTFKFSREGWDDFYAEWDFGRLRQGWKAAAWKQHLKIQEGFRQLVNEEIPTQERLASVLDQDGRHRATGVGLNIVSKVLAVHRPTQWPVYNRPIAETLAAFGYNVPRGMRPSTKYLAFCEMMPRFRSSSGAPDMLALDCFFYWYSKIREA
jgi:HKD family nuclease